jgi:saccharopine dehydrogenase (NAD+, L-lysine forming)
MTNIGLIAESKIPNDKRVALIPTQIKELQSKYPIQFVVEPSQSRCYSDDEYRASGILIDSNMNDCDFLIGIKEIKKENLLPGKTYLFFSHTIKKQSYNREMLKSIIKKNITLIDYELLTDEDGNRIVAFGYYAGMVGAHNALFTYGKRSGKFELPRMCNQHDYEEVRTIYKSFVFPPIKIVVTGTGRVGHGSCKVLDDMGFKKVTPYDFLQSEFSYPIYTQLGTKEYYQLKTGGTFNRDQLISTPDNFESAFLPYSKKADILIHGIYWEKQYPKFFTTDDMKNKSFKIEVIADIACDIAPDSSIPCTIRASTIENPVYGFDPFTSKETPPIC